MTACDRIETSAVMYIPRSCTTSWSHCVRVSMILGASCLRQPRFLFTSLTLRWHRYCGIVVAISIDNFGLIASAVRRISYQYNETADIFRLCWYIFPSIPSIDTPLEPQWKHKLHLANCVQVAWTVLKFFTTVPGRTCILVYTIYIYLRDASVASCWGADFRCYSGAVNDWLTNDETCELSGRQLQLQDLQTLRARYRTLCTNMQWPID